MKNIKYFIFAIITVISTGCDAWENLKDLEGDRDRSLYEQLKANSDLSTFVKVIDITGYAKSLDAVVNYTVFAPDNAALTNLNLNDTTALTAWVKSYLSEKIVYTNKSGEFDINQILVLNGKYISINKNLISGASVSKWNIASKNGVLHILSNTIEERMSIWQYLQTLPNNPVVEFIKSFNETVMDMDRSVQKGVNSNGQPVYDTIWTSRNSLLDSSPLANESTTATFLLPNEDALNALKAKYAKYFAEKDSIQMNHDILKEIVNDMILPYGKISANGRYANAAGVWVDINVGDTIKSYTASNGMVYELKAVNVKMYQNKIKPLVIEGENYVSRWPDAWQVRPRTWASGGHDIMLKSRTRHSYDTIQNSIVNKINNLYSFNYRSENEWPGSNTLGEPNAYISYKPHMYSTTYKIFWKAYDDNADEVHIDARGVPMTFHQKMYISFPSARVLDRSSANVIVNNFSTNTLMAAEMIAGKNEETQLVRYSANNGHSVYANSFVLIQKTKTEDAYGKEDILKCPFYGQATLFVSNTCIGEFTHSDGTVQAYLQSSKASNAPGMIFLDYIRLEPQVDPND
ncbi:MAG: fasciclin domain-containing protein [Paludibacter sp.]